MTLVVSMELDGGGLLRAQMRDEDLELGSGNGSGAEKVIQREMMKGGGRSIS